MSLLEQSFSKRELVNSSKAQPSVKVPYMDVVVPDNSQDCVYTHTPDTVYDEFFSVGNEHEIMVASANSKQDQLSKGEDAAVPALPPRNALRASRLFSFPTKSLEMGNIEPSNATTPHDVYMSSEEDASSSADDFSDYDYESGSEDALSPVQSKSPLESTARLVSVVFAGKPSMVNVSSSRKPVTPATNSLDSSSPTNESSQSSTDVETSSGVSQQPKRPVSAASSIASTVNSIASNDAPNTTRGRHQHRHISIIGLNSPRISEKVTPTGKVMHVLTKPRPPFLSVDPFANSSSYSLQLPKSLPPFNSPGPYEEEYAAATSAPRTPTALLKSVTRTLSVVRKRSRPSLITNPLNASSSRDVLSRDSMVLESPEEADELEAEGQLGSSAVSGSVSNSSFSSSSSQTTTSPSSSLGSSRASVLLQSPVARHKETFRLPPSLPTSPGKRSLLAGLAPRRRSFKFTGRASMLLGE